MTFITTNGVRFTFDKNFVVRLGETPLFEFEEDGDGKKLVAVNFDGYRIEKLDD